MLQARFPIVHPRPRGLAAPTLGSQACNPCRQDGDHSFGFGRRETLGLLSSCIRLADGILIQAIQSNIWKLIFSRQPTGKAAKKASADACCPFDLTLGLTLSLTLGLPPALSTARTVAKASLSTRFVQYSHCSPGFQVESFSRDKAMRISSGSKARQFSII